MSADEKPGRAAPIVGGYQPSKPDPSGQGYVPVGYHRLDVMAQKAGGESLGRWLASAGVVASVQGPHGLKDLPPEFWLTADAREAMDAALVADLSEPCPVFVRGATAGIAASLAQIVSDSAPAENSTDPAEPWWPADGVEASEWVVSGPAVMEAERRVRLVGALTEGLKVAALETMWRSAGRTTAEGSFARLRRRARHG